MQKFQAKVNEFCHNGDLEEFRHVLISIFKKIENENCTISTRYGGPPTHEFTDSNGHCRIRIPIKTYVTNPTEAIWAILHEFGHHQSGPISNSNYQRDDERFVLSRELKAWEDARSELSNYPELLKRIDDFETYSYNCIQSYKRYFRNSR